MEKIHSFESTMKVQVRVHQNCPWSRTQHFDTLKLISFRPHTGLEYVDPQHAL